MLIEDTFLNLHDRFSLYDYKMIILFNIEWQMQDKTSIWV